MNRNEKRRYSLRTKMMLINLGITFASLVLCGVLFVVPISILMEQYVNKDMDFFLTEAGNDLVEKTKYMEDILYEVRNSEQMMQWLRSDRAVEEAGEEELQAEWERVVTISSEKNLGGQNKPLVEKVYLFEGREAYLHTFYYALSYEEIEESNRVFEQVNDMFATRKKQKISDSTFLHMTDKYAYLAYTLYDEHMQDSGNVIFELNLDAVHKSMSNTRRYESSFWMLNDVAQAIAGNQIRTILWDSIKIYILGIVAVLCAGFALLAIFINRMTHPLKELTENMKKVADEEYKSKLPEYEYQEFYEISHTFNTMTERINYLIHQVYEKNITIKEMELKFLQMQMNPHFMFNVLNSIALQAKMDGNEELSNVISSFSKFIQAKIYRDDQEKVQIRQELEYVRYYLELQNFRFGDQLEYELKIEEEALLDFYIPKLALQLVVENAVVHGIEPKMEKGKIFAHIYEKNESVYIDVEDDGIGFEQDGYIPLPLQKRDGDDKHNHIGLDNLHRIIRLKYGQEYGITIFSQAKKGTKVSIHIPFDR